MVKLVRAFPALTIVALASCNDAPTAEPVAKAPASAKLQNSPAVQMFRVKFDELNASGVKPEATLQVSGGSDLTVTLNGVGRVPQQIHPQHIHGFAAQTSTCPTAANDTNGDGVISFAEGTPAFGPVQVDLQPYPTPANAGGATHYRMTFAASAVPFTASELTQKTMVLHGDFVGGSYDATLPVACGRVEAVN
jgi:hypothetical protein